MTDPFAEMRQVIAEKWRADMLEQLQKIRDLLELIALRSEPIKIEIAPLESDTSGCDNIVEQLD